MTKVISFMSTKGGVGKSTAVQLLASSLAQKFFRIAVVEASHYEHLKDWKQRSDEHGTWYPNAIYLNSRDDEEFYKALDDAEKFGAEFVIIDVGRESEGIMALIARDSDLIIYPTNGGKSENKCVRKSISIVSGAVESSHRHPKQAIMFSGMLAYEKSKLPEIKTAVESDNYGITMLENSIRCWEGASLGDIYGMHHNYLRNILYSNNLDQYRTKRTLLEIIRDADAVTDEILRLVQPKTKSEAKEMICA